MTEPVKRTIGTQTSLKESANVAETSSSSADKTSAIATEKAPSTTCSINTSEAVVPTNTVEASPFQEAGKSSPEHKEKEQNTSSTSSSSSEIFSPKSAAVALSNLFKLKPPPAAPRQCFPEPTASSPPQGMDDCANYTPPSLASHEQNFSDYQQFSNYHHHQHHHHTDYQHQQPYHPYPSTAEFQYYAPSFRGDTPPSFHGGPPPPPSHPMHGFAWGGPTPPPTHMYQPPPHPNMMYQQPPPPPFPPQGPSPMHSFHEGNSKRGRPPTPSNTNTSMVTPTPAKKSRLADLAPRGHHHGAPPPPPPAHQATMMHRPLPLNKPPQQQQQQQQQTPPPSTSETQQQQQQQIYSRKNKSLGVLAANFLQKFQHCNVGHEIGLDEAAWDLGCERRRIYDVVNILEALHLMVKKGKNTYAWLGTGMMERKFGELQARAIKDYQDDAVLCGLDTSSSATEVFLEDPADGSSSLPSLGRRSSLGSTTSEETSIRKDSSRSLAKLAQLFLQVFLVGCDCMSLPQASEKIQGSLSPEAYAAIGTAGNKKQSKEDMSDPDEFRRAAQRGLKTKIRRLYDCANVFVAIGLLRKVEGLPGSRLPDSILGTAKRPYFAWKYPLSPKQIQYRFLGIRRHEGLAYPPPSSIRAHVPTIMTEDRTPLRTLADRNSSMMAPPSSGRMTTSSWCSNYKTTPVVTTAGGAMGPPSSVSTTRPSVCNKPQSDSACGILANIHQTGGAWEEPPTPAAMTRKVTLSQEQECNLAAEQARA